MDKSHDDTLNPNAGAPSQSGAAPASSQTTNSTQLPTPAGQQVTSNNQSSAAQNSTASNVAFRSEYIGQWNAKQEDPFAEQNRKAAAKKAAQEATRKKVLPYVKYGGIAAACIAAIAILVVVIINVTKPTPIAELTAEEAVSIKDEAQKIFDKYTQNINLEDSENLTEKEKEEIQKAIEEVGKYYDKQAERAENNDAFVQVILNEMTLYVWNSQPEAALKASEKLSINNMNQADLANYYGQMQAIYYLFGDMEQSNQYMLLMIETIGEDYVAG